MADTQTTVSEPTRHFPMHTEEAAMRSLRDLRLNRNEGRLDEETFQRATNRIMMRWPNLTNP